MKELFDYIKNEYGVEPEYLWKKYPNFAVFRRKDSQKWFAITMDVDYKKLGKNKDGKVWVLNVKLEPSVVDFLLKQDGFVPAYHMSKQSWISICMDGSVEFSLICELIDQSFENVKK